MMYMQHFGGNQSGYQFERTDSIVSGYQSSSIRGYDMSLSSYNPYGNGTPKVTGSNNGHRGKGGNMHGGKGGHVHDNNDTIKQSTTANDNQSYAGTASVFSGDHLSESK